MKKRAFTIVELLVVIALIVILISLLMPVLGKALSRARRVQCMNNLRQIGQCMQVYASENDQSFPRTYFVPNLIYSNSPDTFGGLRAFSNPTSPNPFLKPTVWNWDQVVPAWNVTKRPGDNDVTAALFLLMRQYNLPPALFVCPGRGDRFYSDRFDTFGVAGASGDPAHRSNFSSPFNLGYSMSLPYPPPSAHKIGYRWGVDANAGFALMADLNPGERFADSCVVSFSGFYGGTGPQRPTDPPKLQRMANSRNHEKQGQNVLYVDGHIEWAPTAFAGYHQDNIYTWAGPPGVTTGLTNQWTTAAQCFYSSGTYYLTHPNDSIMQPNEGDTLSTVGGLGIN